MAQAQKQELVFSAALPMPQDYFAGVKQTQKARDVIGDAETKLAELYGEPIKFSATVRPWRDPNAKPRGRAAQRANEAAAAAATNGSGANTTSGTETTGATGAQPQPATGDVARSARPR